jgi:hypothetical protein
MRKAWFSRFCRVILLMATILMAGEARAAHANLAQVGFVGVKSRVARAGVRQPAKMAVFFVNRESGPQGVPTQVTDRI